MLWAWLIVLGHEGLRFGHWVFVLGLVGVVLGLCRDGFGLVRDGLCGMHHNGKQTLLECSNHY